MKSLKSFLTIKEQGILWFMANIGGIERNLAIKTIIKNRKN